MNITSNIRLLETCMKAARSHSWPPASFAFVIKSSIPNEKLSSFQQKPNLIYSYLNNFNKSFTGGSHYINGHDRHCHHCYGAPFLVSPWRRVEFYGNIV
jgi:hypothetical protein